MPLKKTKPRTKPKSKPRRVVRRSTKPKPKAAKPKSKPKPRSQSRSRVIRKKAPSSTSTAPSSSPPKILAKGLAYLHKNPGTTDTDVAMFIIHETPSSPAIIESTLYPAFHELFVAKNAITGISSLVDYAVSEYHARFYKRVANVMSYYAALVKKRDNITVTFPPNAVQSYLRIIFHYLDDLKKQLY